MILFSLYLALFSALLFYNRFFGLFKDETISRPQLAILLFLKGLAVPVFYFVYKKLYGGVELFDAGKFYHDSLVIHHYAYRDFFGFVKILFGLQNDSPGSQEYMDCLVSTLNWDNGTVKDYLYNDNRIVIRIHSVLNFLAFDSYLVHGLFNCFFGFTGIYFFYRSLKEFFVAKEFWFLIILGLFPALWFYTGAVLKEGLLLFFLGISTLQVKKAIYTGLSIKKVFLLLFLTFISLLLKPYVLFFSAFCFAVFFVIQKSDRVKRKIPAFISFMVIFFVALNLLSVIIKDRSLLGAMQKHQRIFAGVAKGGVFLSDSTKFLRIEFDTNLVSKFENNDSLYRIKKNTPYMYWKDNKADDTLYCASNLDTLSVYKLVYKIAKSNSNISTSAFSDNFIFVLGRSMYYSLLHPLFYNAKGVMQLLASVENLILLISLLLTLWGIYKNQKQNFLPFVLVFICFCVCFLVSFSAPNSGAIFRYRSPVVIFILLSALYYMPLGGTPKNSV